MSRKRGPYEDLQSRESDAVLPSDDIEAAGYRLTASSAAVGSTSALAAVGLVTYLLGRPSRYLWGFIRRRR